MTSKADACVREDRDRHEDLSLFSTGEMDIGARFAHGLRSEDASALFHWFVGIQIGMWLWKGMEMSQGQIRVKFK